MKKTLAVLLAQLDNLYVQEKNHIIAHNTSEVPYTLISNSKNPQTIMWQEACITSHMAKFQSVFFGLQGEMQDGSKFACDAIRKGASLAFISNVFAKKYGADIRELLKDISHEYALIAVDSVLMTMTSLAKQVRESKRETCIFIGVTGSAGKTSTKNIIYHLLNINNEAMASQGNLNTPQGMSLCLLNADWSGIKYAVLECGISASGEMSDLVNILDPDHAIVTNVGFAHMGGYKDIDELRREKLSIASQLPPQATLWLPDNDTDLLELSAHMATHMGLVCQIHTHGIHSLKDYLGWVDKKLEGIVLNFTQGSIEIPLLGEVNVYNSLLAISFAMYLSVSFEDCKKSLKSIKGVEGRYQILRHIPLVIDDSYNASPNAVKKASEWFSHFSHKKKILVLAGMKELGKDEEKIHQALVKFVQKLAISNILLLGKEYDACNITHAHLKRLHDKDALLEEVCVLTKDVDAQDVAMLIKGSRFYMLETFAQKFLALI